MKKDELSSLLPREGFLKVSRPDRSSLSSADRAVLIRKGNEHFNTGNFELAKRIFITTGYSDGLIRAGDHYLKKGDSLEALRLYWLAPAPEKIDLLLEQTASVIRRWLSEKE